MVARLGHLAAMAVTAGGVTVTQAIANVGGASTAAPVFSQQAAVTFATAVSTGTTQAPKVAKNGVTKMPTPPAQGYWSDQQDSLCVPMESCTGNNKAIPTLRGICVGPVAVGCSTGQCQCMDVCNPLHTVADYSGPDWGEPQKIAQEMLVQNARRGGAKEGVENIDCPRATEKEADDSTCGTNNQVGEGCQFDNGIGQCAQHDASGKVLCLDVCNWKYNIRDFGRGGTDAARQRFEYQRASCYSPWYVILFEVLLFLAALALCVLGGLWLGFKLRSAKRRSGNFRSLHDDFQPEHAQEMQAPYQKPVYAQAPPAAMEAPMPESSRQQYPQQAPSHGSQASSALPPMPQATTLAAHAQAQYSRPQYSTLPQAPSHNSQASYQPYGGITRVPSQGMSQTGTYALPAAGAYATNPGSRPGAYATMPTGSPSYIAQPAQSPFGYR